VAVSVYPREVLQTYADVIYEANLLPLSFETEGSANARSVIARDEKSTIMVVDIGKLGTELTIVSKGTVAFTTSVEVSGDDFTHAIERYFAVSFEAAAKIKDEKGFVKSNENNEVFETLIGNVSVLRDEINKHLTFWQMHSGMRKAIKEDVEKIVLCGGGSNLKGLIQYLSVTMSIPVETANVWTNVADFSEYIPTMEKSKSLAYATSLGLALRSIDKVF